MRLISMIDSYAQAVSLYFPHVLSEFARSWTCGCLKMRTGELGAKAWWTGTLRFCAWASSLCSAYWKATSQTSTQPCPQSWLSPSTTASWRAWGVSTSRSSLRVGEPMTSPSLPSHFVVLWSSLPSALEPHRSAYKTQNSCVFFHFSQFSQKNNKLKNTFTNKYQNGSTCRCSPFFLKLDKTKHISHGQRWTLQT